jgi:tetratricopeptide (TPR) repeat protein
MNGRNRTILLIATTLLLLSILVVLVVLDLPFGPEKQAGRLLELIEQADEAISRGYYEQAATILERASETANSSVEWLRILKRAHTLATTTGSYEGFAGIASKARKAFPNRQDIAACAVYGMMRTGMVHEATILEAVEKLGQDFDSLTAEVYLLRGVGRDIVENMDGYFGDFVQTVQQRDPDDLSRLAGFENDPRLFLDAALLLMLDGERERANSLSSRREVETEFPEAAMTIAYDSGDVGRATDIYRSVYWYRTDIPPDIRLFGSDIFLDAGLSETAKENYREFLSKFPDHSWIPYYNLSLLHQGTQEEVDVVREGLKRFPGNELLSVRYAVITSKNGDDRQAAMRILEELRDHGSFGQAAALEVLRLTKSELSKKRFEAELWRMFNSEDVIEDTVVYLLWYLAGIGDTDSMELILKRSESMYTNAWWQDFYAGVIDYKDGKVKGAIEEFREAGSGRAPWETEYNLGLAYLVSGDYATAAHFMREALDVAGKRKDEGIEPQTEATILTGLAMVLLESGDREGALREVRYALELDQTNLSASLILKRATTK